MNHSSIPYVVDFDVTFKCNLSCLHCNVNAGNELEYEMSTDEVKSIIKQLYDSGTVALALTGGEPLLRKDWREIVTYACSKVGMKIVLNTNGILFTSNDIEYLAENCKNLQVAISLDGSTPNSFGLLRKYDDGSSAESSFNKIIENTKLLKKAGMRYVSFNMTLTKLNIDYFESLIDLSHNLNIDRVLGIKFFQGGRGKKNSNNLELSYKQWSTFIRKLTKNKLENPFRYNIVNISITCPWEFKLPLNNRLYSEEQIFEVWRYNSPTKFNKLNRDIGCTAGVMGCAIAPNGDLYPCGTVTTESSGMKCGNVFESSVIDVWENSDFLKKLRNINVDQINGHCKVCNIKDYCGGGCRGRAFTKYKDILANDPLCPLNGR